METTTIKKQTAFRLNENLINRLKVETILMDSIYNQPNETTIKAIEEARSGKTAGVANMSDLESFIQSCSE